MIVKISVLAICGILLLATGCAQKQPLQSASSSPNVVSTANVSSPTSTPAPTVPPADSPKGYLLVEASNVLFIRWTEADKKLSGQLQVYITQTNKDKKESDSSTHAFTGIVDKENISLNFSGSVWTDSLGGQTWTGTLSGNKLTLVIPSSDGKLNTAVLQPATVEDYNRAVASIQTTVADNNARVDQQKAEDASQKAEADRLAREQDAVISADQKLTANIGVLTKTISKGPDFGPFDKVLADYEKHDQVMQQHYQKLISDTSKNPLPQEDFYMGQSDYYTMQSDKYTIQSDRYTLNAIQRDVENYLSRLEEGKKYIKQGWNNLQVAISKNSTRTPTSNITKEDIAKLMSDTQAQIDNVKAAMNGKLIQADSYEKQCGTLLKTAEDYLQKLRP